MPLADMCDPEEEKQLMESMVGVDDVSGEPIDPSLIVKARQEEMRGFTERGVYHHVPRRVAEADPEGKFIGVRWVDVNKGTMEVPECEEQACGTRVRTWTTTCRLVCSDPSIGCSPSFAILMRESGSTRSWKPPRTLDGHLKGFPLW